MDEVRFSLDLPVREILKFYGGVASVVVAISQDGRRVQFPAHNLRPFVTNEGVRGEFALRFDGRHKLVELRRID